MKPITVYVSEEVYRDFQAQASREECATSELIREAMELFRRERILPRSRSLLDFEPVSVGKVLKPLASDDDLLDEMLNG